MSLLAGDIGGTKTLLGLFDGRRVRPRPLLVREYGTLEFASLREMIAAFAANAPVHDAPIEVACFGVAGPVIGNTAELTNVPWRIDAGELGRALGIPHVTLLNDLQAMACAVPVLEGDELRVLQQGEALRGGNIALIAAGTGLGQALLHNVEGHFVPSPSEGGHADWAPRTEQDIELLRDLIERFGRAEVEHVVSGHGLVNIHRITHRGSDCDLVNEADANAPAAISKAALEGRCAGCVAALTMFVDAYGAEAGNVALRNVATGGIFIGGGIAPKILPALTDGRFMRAFRAKGTFEQLLSNIPVRVILNADAGLLGAAVSASGLKL